MILQDLGQQRGRHWFDIPSFFQEADRVLKPKGILVVWSYNLLHIASDLDEVINYFYASILGKFWPPERKMAERRCRQKAGIDPVAKLERELTAFWKNTAKKNS